MIYRDSDIGSLHIGCPDAIWQFEISFYILKVSSGCVCILRFLLHAHKKVWGVWCEGMGFFLLFHTKQVLHILEEGTYLNFSVVDYSFFPSMKNIK